MVIERAAPEKAVGALARFGGRMLKTSLSDGRLTRPREALRQAPFADTA